MRASLASRRSAFRWPTALAAIATLSLLSGCATRLLPSAERLGGRLAVRIDNQPDRSVSASFELTGNARAGQLLLTTPLGTTAALASWQPGLVTLRQAGGDEQRFDSLDALATQALGEALPLAALFDWLRGRPWPEAASQPRADGQPGFVQLGWQVNMARWDEGWVEARRSAAPVVTVRAKLDKPD